VKVWTVLIKTKVFLTTSKSRPFKKKILYYGVMFVPIEDVRLEKNIFGKCA
jgi:hypothetical protein